jgi:hypothetical protein
MDQFPSKKALGAYSRALAEILSSKFSILGIKNE